MTTDKDSSRGSGLKPIIVAGSAISATIDLCAQGKHTGYLRVPHSTDDSAYGWIPIPIVSIANGDGPRVLLTAGNHGDEFEGQIALSKLVRETDSHDVVGQLLILPCLNLPAGLAGRRVSPADGGNLNRSFPGNPAGTPTEMLAHFIENCLMPCVDAAIDLHSGGSSLRYFPSTMVRRGTGEAADRLYEPKLNLIRTFGAPGSFTLEAGMGGGTSFLAAAERAGLLAIGTEIGGGGTTTRELVEIAEQGVRRVLSELGVLRSSEVVPQEQSRHFIVGGEEYFVHAPDDGVFECWVEPGREVRAGDIAGVLHWPETPWRDSMQLNFARDGTVLAVRVPCRTRRGDCVAQIGRAMPFEQMIGVCP
jgi:hypothetical protein